MSFFDNKTILITGGCGSFGQKFAQVVLRDHSPQSLRVYDHDEFGLVEMERAMPDSRIRFLLGDVRDKERLSRAMNGVEIVVHAAALKHVPVCEYNPIEAAKTNIDGAKNVIDAALDNAVDRVMAVSTDKAVYPVNLYGATKMVAEKLFTQGNVYRGGQGRTTKFSCARYGNVIGSNGSVIPLFVEQRKSGEITLTDERMTRFWIDLEEGVQFVIRSIEQMEGGEIFVPRLPSMKMVDLVEVIAPGASRRIIGIRPGEKLHEALITPEEADRTIQFSDHYVIAPAFPFWGSGNHQEGTQVSSDFFYASHTNDWWLTREEMYLLCKEFLI
ncbi:MAG: UDP-N-acetylglucosamine 4,6-dehydratase (inverting) [Patescibacteria group bacterium]